MSASLLENSLIYESGGARDLSPNLETGPETIEKSDLGVV